MATTSLGAAKAAKNDEFYTQLPDIEREMQAYVDYDPDVFRGRTLLLPCDDPEWSNFTRYFALNFDLFGIRRLISTSYAPDAKKAKYGVEPTLFGAEAGSPSYDPDKWQTHGRIMVLDRDTNGDSRVDIDDLRWEYLDGDGDFRSKEVTALRDEADIIVTNPPFSLFREFLAWIEAGGKKFSVIGNMNAITYKEVFPLIKANKIWLGNGFANSNAYFATPFAGRYGEGVLQEDGLVKFRNCCWFTNIELGKRHEPLPLMTMADNLKFSRHKEIREKGYRRYDNYDAIEVPYTDAIPSDCCECLGVPVSFLDKYDPEQFLIIGATESEGKGFSGGLWNPESGVAQALINGNRVYKRLFVKAIAPPMRQMSINELREYVIAAFGYAPEEVAVVSGVMGVPISFLDKYCPEQFEITGITKTWFGGASKTYPEQIQVSKDGKKSAVTKLNDGATLALDAPPEDETYYNVGGKLYTQVYARILIRKIATPL